MRKVELAKDLRDLYTASKKVKEVIAERGTFLYVDGRGEPGGEAFQAAIATLYAVGYTVKFALKNAGVLDFKMSKLECLWLIDDPERVSRSQWSWQLLLRVPDEVSATHLKKAREALREKKGLDASAVRRKSWKEGRALQILHVGPYDQLHTTYKKLLAHARQIGARVKGSCHEVYLSDPRRAAPDRLRTIVRCPISLPRPEYARSSS